MSTLLVPALVARASRAGWADATGHARGAQAILTALAAIVDPRTGTGRTTIRQVAIRAGYRSRWTGEQLRALEDEGLIRWTRGRVIDGRRTASTITVVKTAVLELVARVRAHRDRADADHDGRERWRLRGRTLANRSKSHRRRSPLVAVGAYPPPIGGYPTAVGGVGGRPWEAETYCEHDGIAGRCPSCRNRRGSAAADDA